MLAGGYIYFADGHAELYTVGENITGTISNAQATILAIEPEDNRIKVKESTHTGVFNQVKVSQVEVLQQKN